jgi:hypothetical protein
MNRIQTIWCFNFFFVISLFASTMPIVSEAEESLVKLDQNWIGDFDEMVERHRIRALVPYSKTFYFLDGATQRGLTYDLLKGFEKARQPEAGQKDAQGGARRDSDPPRPADCRPY